MPAAAAAPLLAEGGAVAGAGAAAEGGAAAGAGAGGGSGLLTGAMRQFGGSALTSGGVGRFTGGGHGGGKQQQEKPSLVARLTQPGLSANSNAAYTALIQPAQFHR